MENRWPAADVITVNALLSACAKAAEWTQALHLFHVMPHWELEADLISYSSAISCCEKAGQWQRALNFLASYKHLFAAQKKGLGVGGG